jgi:putative two-component system response regulator
MAARRPTMSKKKILLVDDESGFTRLLRLTLPAYEIREENNPLKAVQTAQDFKPDMIFLDVIMPEADGGTIAAQMKEDPVLRHVPIVFLTAIVSKDEAKDRQEIGGCEFLAKPVSRDQIAACIMKHLGPG